MFRQYNHVLTAYLAALLIICLIWTLGLHLLPDKNTVWHYVYNSLYALIFLLGGGLGLYSGLQFKLASTGGKALFFLGFGLLSWCLGLFIWTYFNLVLKVEVPYPSLADVFFSVLFYVPLAIGCIYTVRLFTVSVPKSLMLESLIVVLVALGIVWSFFSNPDLSETAGWVERLLRVAYPVGDVMLISIAVIAIRIYRVQMPLPLIILTIGFIIQTVADLIFSYRTATSLYWNGDLSDILFTLAGFAMSLGVLGIRQSLLSIRDK